MVYLHFRPALDPGPWQAILAAADREMRLRPQVRVARGFNDERTQVELKREHFVARPWRGNDPGWLLGFEGLSRVSLLLAWRFRPQAGVPVVALHELDLTLAHPGAEALYSLDMLYNAAPLALAGAAGAQRQVVAAGTPEDPPRMVRVRERLPLEPIGSQSLDGDSRPLFGLLTG